MIRTIFVIAITLRTIPEIEFRVGELRAAADAALVLCLPRPALYISILWLTIAITAAVIILPVAPLLSSVISPSEVPLPSGLTRAPESFCLEKIDQEVHE